MTKRVLRSFLMLILVAAAGHAQQLATLSVTVADPSGKVIAGADVSLSASSTGLTRNGQTNRAGFSVLTAIAAGDYDLTVEANGFSVWKHSLTLTVGQTASVPVQMRLAAVKESVTVSGTETQGIETEKTEASDVIHPGQIDNLPISDRDFIDFVLLTPNANVGRSTATASQSAFQESVLELSFDGLRETRSTYFGLDGTDYNVTISGVQRVSPSLDWVQEFRVIDGPYTADYGRNLGSVVETITKSGTNDVHGSAYEYFRNAAADANNPLSDPGFNALRFNQFGADVGGPIHRDKTFYFAGYEGQRQAQSPIYSTFVLGCINTPGCMGPGTPSINQVKQMFGLQQEQLNSILLIDNYDKAMGKITQVFDERNILNAGYLFTDDRKINTPSAAPGEGLPSTYRDNPVRDQTVYGSYLHLFGPRLTSETVIDYGQRVYNLTPIGAGFEPTLNVSDTLVTGGFAGSVPYYEEPHFEVQENLTWVHGAHTLKFGGGFEPVWVSTHTTFFSPGSAIFTPQSFFGAGSFAGPPFGPRTPVQFIFLEPRTYVGQQIPARAGALLGLDLHRLGRAEFYRCHQPEVLASPDEPLRAGHVESDTKTDAKRRRALRRGHLSRCIRHSLGRPHESYELQQCATARGLGVRPQWRTAGDSRGIWHFPGTVGLRRHAGWSHGLGPIHSHEQSTCPRPQHTEWRHRMGTGVGGGCVRAISCLSGICKFRQGGPISRPWRVAAISLFDYAAEICQPVCGTSKP